MNVIAVVVKHARLATAQALDLVARDVAHEAHVQLVVDDFLLVLAHEAEAIDDDTKYDSTEQDDVHYRKERHVVRDLDKGEKSQRGTGTQ